MKKFDPKRFQRGVLHRWIKDPVFRVMGIRLLIRSWIQHVGIKNVEQKFAGVLTSEFNQGQQVNIIINWLEHMDPSVAGQFATTFLEQASTREFRHFMEQKRNMEAPGISAGESDFQSQDLELK